MISARRLHVAAAPRAAVLSKRAWLLITALVVATFLWVAILRVLA